MAYFLLGTTGPWGSIPQAVKLADSLKRLKVEGAEMIGGCADFEEGGSHTLISVSNKEIESNSVAGLADLIMARYEAAKSK